MYNASVYRIIALATVLFSLLSFSHAGQFSPSSLEEVKHYAAGDDFIGSRSFEDDNAYLPPETLFYSVPTVQMVSAPLTENAVVSPLYNLQDIRGPPVVAVLS
ncbi:MAG TPA: hypothetical protein VKZ92_04445 [Pseudohongiella sp.]|nr:hypothetical protein [Pseudohongiella sp.]